MPELRFDAGILGKVERTPQGGVRIPSFVARSGVLEYRRADGQVRREYVPPAELFATDSMQSLRDAPLTDGHQALVTPANVQELSLGHIGGDSVRRDGFFLASSSVLQSERAITRADAGELVELSAAYRLELDPTPGTVPDGEPDAGKRYDAIQRKRVYNHVALLRSDEGRAGREVAFRLDSSAAICDAIPVLQSKQPEESPDMTVRFDSKEYSTEAAALGAAQALLDQERTNSEKVRADAAETGKVAQKALDVANARADAAEVEVKKLQADAADDSKLAALVQERVKILNKAGAVIGDTFNADRADKTPKTAREIMVETIRADRKDFDDKDRSDDYIQATFDLVTEKSSSRADSIARVPEVLRSVRADAETAQTEADKKHAEMVKHNQDAWKTPKAGS